MKDSHHSEGKTVSKPSKASKTSKKTKDSKESVKSGKKDKNSKSGASTSKSGASKSKSGASTGKSGSSAEQGSGRLSQKPSQGFDVNQNPVSPASSGLSTEDVKQGPIKASSTSSNSGESSKRSILRNSVDKKASAESDSTQESVRKTTPEAKLSDNSHVHFAEDEPPEPKKGEQSSSPVDPGPPPLAEKEHDASGETSKSKSSKSSKASAKAPSDSTTHKKSSASCFPFRKKSSDKPKSKASKKTDPSISPQSVDAPQHSEDFRSTSSVLNQSVDLNSSDRTKADPIQEKSETTAAAQDVETAFIPAASTKGGISFDVSLASSDIDDGRIHVDEADYVPRRRSRTRRSSRRSSGGSRSLGRRRVSFSEEAQTPAIFMTKSILTQTVPSTENESTQTINVEQKEQQTDDELSSPPSPSESEVTLLFGTTPLNNALYQSLVIVSQPFPTGDSFCSDTMRESCVTIEELEEVTPEWEDSTPKVLPHCTTTEPQTKPIYLSCEPYPKALPHCATTEPQTKQKFAPCEPAPSIAPSTLRQVVVGEGDPPCPVLGCTCCQIPINSYRPISPLRHRPEPVPPCIWTTQRAIQTCPPVPPPPCEDQAAAAKIVCIQCNVHPCTKNQNICNPCQTQNFSNTCRQSPMSRRCSPSTAAVQRGQPFPQKCPPRPDPAMLQSEVDQLLQVVECLSHIKQQQRNRNSGLQKSLRHLHKKKKQISSHIQADKAETGRKQRCLSEIENRTKEEVKVHANSWDECCKNLNEALTEREHTLLKFKACWCHELNQLQTQNARLDAAYFRAKARIREIEFQSISSVAPNESSLCEGKTTEDAATAAVLDEAKRDRATKFEELLRIRENYTSVIEEKACKTRKYFKCFKKELQAIACEMDACTGDNPEISPILQRFIQSANCMNLETVRESLRQAKDRTNEMEYGQTEMQNKMQDIQYCLCELENAGEMCDSKENEHKLLPLLEKYLKNSAS